MTAEIIAAIVACLLGLAGLIGAVTAWIKSKTAYQNLQNERALTKASRDQSEVAIRDSVLKLQFEVQALKDTTVLHAEHIDDLNKQSATLNTTLAQVLVKLDNIFDQIKELKK